jgi:hypothetical protein
MYQVPRVLNRLLTQLCAFSTIMATRWRNILQRSTFPREVNQKSDAPDHIRECFAADLQQLDATRF